MWKNYGLGIIPNDDRIVCHFIQSCYLEVHIVLPQNYTLPSNQNFKNADVALFRKND